MENVFYTKVSHIRRLNRIPIVVIRIKENHWLIRQNHQIKEVITQSLIRKRTLIKGKYSVIIVTDLVTLLMNVGLVLVSGRNQRKVQSKLILLKIVLIQNLLC